MRDTEAGAFFGQLAVSRNYVTRKQLRDAWSWRMLITVYDD